LRHGKPRQNQSTIKVSLGDKHWTLRHTYIRIAFEQKIQLGFVPPRR